MNKVLEIDIGITNMTQAVKIYDFIILLPTDKYVETIIEIIESNTTILSDNKSWWEQEKVIIESELQSCYGISDDEMTFQIYLFSLLDDVYKKLKKK